MTEVSSRVLCLGNDLIADDAAGCAAASLLRERLPDHEVIEAAGSGLYLMDDLVDTDRLVVIDAIVTGSYPPGTIHVFEEGDIDVTPGGSPHYFGLFETLEMARALGLAAPSQVSLVCIEAEDTTSIGGPMTARVAAAVPQVVDLAVDMVSG
ncbi:MAG: hydrogenase maturation protease [Acidimicrobiia bacterium]|nr:hydrogenase maturation protease [Acidimicrobiia bacterium]